MTGETLLLLDISSGSTGAAIVRTNPNGLPSVLAAERTPFFVHDEPTTAKLEVAMVASLQKTLSLIAPKTAIHKALVTLSSPWLTTHLKTVIIARDKGFVLDYKTIQSVIAEEEELFKAKLEKSFDGENEIFESVVTNLYLNGYEYVAPIDEKVAKAEFSFLLGATASGLIRKVEDEINKVVRVKRVVFNSFSFAFFKVLAHAFRSLHSALLINMTAEMTDILFFRHGNSAISASLPFGPSAIARTVAQELNVSLQIAYSYLSLYAAGSFDAANTQAIDSILAQVEARWKSLWQNMSESIQEGGEVPYSVFLIVPVGFEKFAKAFLEKVFVGRKIVLLGLDSTLTKEIAKMEGEAHPDENLLILTGFSNLLR